MTSFERPVWAFSEEELPCRCCSPGFAMEDDLWQCKQGPAWQIVDESPDLTKEHDFSMCDGTCGNPLHNRSNLQLAYAEFNAVGWGDLDQMWLDEELSTLSESEKKQREAEAEAKRQEEERVAEIEHQARIITNKVRDHAIWAGCKDHKGKTMAIPCKFLYDCQGDRKNGGSRPTTLHVTTECWSFCYTCPETGKTLRPTLADGTPVCRALHPGQVGWLKEWDTNRNFRPVVAAAPAPNNRFSNLGAPQPQRAFHTNTNTNKPNTHYNTKPTTNYPTKPAATKPKNNNMFTYFDDSD